MMRGYLDRMMRQEQSEQRGFAPLILNDEQAKRSEKQLGWREGLQFIRQKPIPVED